MQLNLVEVTINVKDKKQTFYYEMKANPFYRTICPLDSVISQTMANLLEDLCVKKGNSPAHCFFTWLLKCRWMSRRRYSWRQSSAIAQCRH